MGSKQDLGLVLGVNSIDIMNFGHKTGPHSGPNSVLVHYKFRYVSKLQKLLGPGSGPDSGPDSGPTKMSIELPPGVQFNGHFRDIPKLVPNHIWSFDTCLNFLFPSTDIVRKP